jgi:hypothetical protein
MIASAKVDSNSLLFYVLFIIERYHIQFISSTARNNIQIKIYVYSKIGCPQISSTNQRNELLKREP